MLLNADSEDDHCYLYARVIGIFHADVCDQKHMNQFQRIEFLLLRWYEVVEPTKSGFKAKRLYRVRFMPVDDPFAFDFVDPDHVLRASHLIPQFRLGRTKTQQPTIARRPDEKDRDWKEYAVNMWVNIQ